jgi:hypothetical protein
VANEYPLGKIEEVLKGSTADCKESTHVGVEFPRLLEVWNALPEHLRDGKKPTWERITEAIGTLNNTKA